MTDKILHSTHTKNKVKKNGVKKMNGWGKWIALFIFLISAYKYRYKLVNVLLGSYFLRRSIVKIAMSIPKLRSTFISSAFK